MKTAVSASLALALGLFLFAGGADQVRAEEGRNLAAPIAANSNASEWPTPRLSANTNTGVETPMAREKPLPSGASKTHPSPESRNILAVALAGLALVVSRLVLRRLRSRSDSS